MEADAQLQGRLVLTLVDQRACVLSAECSSKVAEHSSCLLVTLEAQELGGSLSGSAGFGVDLVIR